MATRVAAVAEVTGIEEMERQLVELVEQVEREKEKTRDTFQQLHSLLVVREGALMRELDEVVVEARQELKEKREVLQELQEARESAEQKLKKNILKDVLKKHLRNLEDEIRELSKPLSVTWVEVEWKREQLEQSIVEVSKVVKKKERPFRTEDYSLKLRPVWYHEGTASSVIEYPQQLAIHTESGNIFVADSNTNKIQVFDNTGHYLYHIPTPPEPTGLCLSDEFIFVTTDEDELLKIQISNKTVIKSVRTDNSGFCGIDISNNIYVCEFRNLSVSVFDTNLNLLNRIPLKSPHFTSNTLTVSIRLHENNMFVMFVESHYRLQLFSQDGQLIRGVIPSSDIAYSFFFSLDRIGNIIVADCSGNEIKIFSNSGRLLHSISNDTLTEDQKLCSPKGISVDKQNNIVVANHNKKCCLISF